MKLSPRLVLAVVMLGGVTLVHAGQLLFEGVPVDITSATNEDVVIAPGEGGNTQVGDKTGTNTNATSNDDLWITGVLEVDGAGYLDGALTVGGAATVSGATTLSGAATVTGATTLNGAVTLGDATSDTVTVTGRLASSAVPGADSTYDLGSSSLAWSNLYADAIKTTDGTDLAITPDTGEGVTATVTRNAATGNEVLFNLAGTANKATSGNYTGLKLNVTETAAPGSADKLLDLQVGGTSWLQAFNGANSANYGTLSLGSAAWDGSTSGYFAGSSSGTLLAGNAASGFAGNLLDLQVAGTSLFKVDASGNVTQAGATTQSGNIDMGTNLVLNIGNASTDFTSGGGLTLAGALAANGSATLGDASSDAVTLNAGTLTLANDTAVTLSGGTDGINFDANTLSIDATNDRVGIGTASPSYKLDVADSAATASTRAFNIAQTGAITGTGYGAYISKTGASTTNVGLYATASGATNNYAAVFDAGNVGIGDTSPDQLLEILSSGAAATQLSIGNTNAGDYDPQIGFELADGTNTFTLGVDDSDSDKFKISVTALGTNDRLVIDSSGNVGIGATSPAGRLHLAGNLSAASWTTTGIGLQQAAATYTDTDAAGTRASAVAASFAQPTFAGTNAVTVTDAATLYIANAPTAGTNMTLTNPYALWVDDGAVKIDGNLTVGGTQTFTGNTTFSGDLAVNGNTTLGNASGDTVTANAAAWTFANDTAVTLSGGTDGINFDANTLSIDATNDRVGIGTASPSAKLHSLATTEQLRLDYNGSNYTAFTQDGNGDLTVDTTRYMYLPNPTRIGSAGDLSIAQLAIGGTSAANIESSLSLSQTVNPAANRDAEGLSVGTTIVEAATGTHAMLSGVSISVPAITAGDATVTDTATLYISGAPSATVTGVNHALWVASGVSRFGGDVGISDATPDASLEVVNDGSGDSFLVADTNDGDTTPFVIQADGDVGIGTASPAGRLHLAGNASAASWTTAGIGFQQAAATYTDTDATGTRAAGVATSFAQPTFAGTNAVTVTDAATVYIANAPTAGTNMTLTNPYALWVDDGAVKIDGNLTVGGTQTFTGNTTFSGDLAVNGNTTLGNASGDTVTANAAAWTFANDTAVTLSGGTDGINFDANTLSIDATNDRVGIGTASPSAKLHSLATTEQLRLGYDASNYVSFTTSSTGGLTIDPIETAALVMDVDRLRPATDAGLQLGSSTVRWSSLNWTGGLNAYGVNGALLTSTVPAAVNGTTQLFVVDAGNITEAASGNHPALYGTRLNVPTVTAGAATVSDTANLYVAGPMTATVSGANYALWVDDGVSRLDGSIGIGGGSQGYTQMYVAGSFTPTSTAAASSAMLIQTTVAGQAGTDASLLEVNGTITEAASGNHGLLAGVKIPAQQIGAGAATVSDTANLYVAGALSATVSGANHALWVDDGVSRFDGNVGFGTSTFGTSAAGVLGIKNGTAPSSSPADMVQLYAEDVAASSELKVRDEAGNATTLSPHNFSLIQGGPSEPMAWAFYSERDGKAINVDMLKAVRAVEAMSGEQLVHIKDANDKLQMTKDEGKMTNVKIQMTNEKTEEAMLREEVSQLRAEVAQLKRLLQVGPQAASAAHGG